MPFLSRQAVCLNSNLAKCASRGQYKLRLVRKVQNFSSVDCWFLFLKYIEQGFAAWDIVGPARPDDGAIHDFFAILFDHVFAFALNDGVAHLIVGFFKGRNAGVPRVQGLR